MSIICIVYIVHFYWIFCVIFQASDLQTEDTDINAIYRWLMSGRDGSLAVYNCLSVTCLSGSSICDRQVNPSATDFHDEAQIQSLSCTFLCAMDFFHLLPSSS